jgi:adenylate cyclase class 2
MPHSGFPGAAVVTGSTETEIKLRIENPGSIEDRLAALGFEIVKTRTFEANTVFDYEDTGLRSRGCLLRLRDAGGRAIITFKGPAERSKHKSREELETTIGDPDIGGRILERLGFQPVFRYEKYRTEYERPGEQGVVTMDETPIGWFVELEGMPDWIDSTAAALGAGEENYITASYGTLYVNYCKHKNICPSNMVFALLR